MDESNENNLLKVIHLDHYTQSLFLEPTNSLEKYNQYLIDHPLPSSSSSSFDFLRIPNGENQNKWVFPFPQDIWDFWINNGIDSTNENYIELPTSNEFHGGYSFSQQIVDISFSSSSFSTFSSPSNEGEEGEEEEWNNKNEEEKEKEKPENQTSTEFEGEILNELDYCYPLKYRRLWDFIYNPEQFFDRNFSGPSRRPFPLRKTLLPPESLNIVPPFLPDAVLPGSLYSNWEYSIPLDYQEPDLIQQQGLQVQQKVAFIRAHGDPTLFPPDSSSSSPKEEEKYRFTPHDEKIIQPIRPIYPTTLPSSYQFFSKNQEFMVHVPYAPLVIRNVNSYSTNGWYFFYRQKFRRSPFFPFPSSDVELAYVIKARRLLQKQQAESPRDAILKALVKRQIRNTELLNHDIFVDKLTELLKISLNTNAYELMTDSETGEPIYEDKPYKVVCVQVKNVYQGDTTDLPVQVLRTFQNQKEWVLSVPPFLSQSPGAIDSYRNRVQINWDISSVQTSFTFQDQASSSSSISGLSDLIVVDPLFSENNVVRVTCFKPGIYNIAANVRSFDWSPYLGMITIITAWRFQIIISQINIIHSSSPSLISSAHQSPRKSFRLHQTPTLNWIVHHFSNHFIQSRFNSLANNNNNINNEVIQDYLGQYWDTLMEETKQILDASSSSSSSSSFFSLRKKEEERRKGRNITRLPFLFHSISKFQGTELLVDTEDRIRPCTFVQSNHFTEEDNDYVDEIYYLIVSSFPPIIRPIRYFGEQLVFNLKEYFTLFDIAHAQEMKDYSFVSWSFEQSRLEYRTQALFDDLTVAVTSPKQLGFYFARIYIKESTWALQSDSTNELHFVIPNNDLTVLCQFVFFVEAMFLSEKDPIPRSRFTFASTNDALGYFERLPAQTINPFYNSLSYYCGTAEHLLLRIDSFKEDYMHLLKYAFYGDQIVKIFSDHVMVIDQVPESLRPLVPDHLYPPYLYLKPSFSSAESQTYQEGSPAYYVIFDPRSNHWINLLNLLINTANIEDSSSSFGVVIPNEELKKSIQFNSLLRTFSMYFNLSHLNPGPFYVDPIPLSVCVSSPSLYIISSDNISPSQYLPISTLVTSQKKEKEKEKKMGSLMSVADFYLFVREYFENSHQQINQLIFSRYQSIVSPIQTLLDKVSTEFLEYDKRTNYEKYISQALFQFFIPNIIYQRKFLHDLFTQVRLSCLEKLPPFNKTVYLNELTRELVGFRNAMGPEIYYEVRDVITDTCSFMEQMADTDLGIIFNPTYVLFGYTLPLSYFPEGYRSRDYDFFQVAVREYEYPLREFIAAVKPETWQFPIKTPFHLLALILVYFSRQILTPDSTFKFDLDSVSVFNLAKIDSGKELYEQKLESLYQSHAFLRITNKKQFGAILLKHELFDLKFRPRSLLPFFSQEGQFDFLSLSSPISKENFFRSIIAAALAPIAFDQREKIHRIFSFGKQEVGSKQARNTREIANMIISIKDNDGGGGPLSFSKFVESTNSINKLGLMAYFTQQFDRLMTYLDQGNVFYISLLLYNLTTLFLKYRKRSLNYFLHKMYSTTRAFELWQQDYLFSPLRKQKIEKLMTVILDRENEEDYLSKVEAVRQIFKFKNHYLHQYRGKHPTIWPFYQQTGFDVCISQLHEMRIFGNFKPPSSSSSSSSSSFLEIPDLLQYQRRLPEELIDKHRRLLLSLVFPEFALVDSFNPITDWIQFKIEVFNLNPEDDGKVDLKQHLRKVVEASLSTRDLLFQNIILFNIMKSFLFELYFV